MNQYFLTGSYIHTGVGQFHYVKQFQQPVLSTPDTLVTNGFLVIGVIIALITLCYQFLLPAKIEIGATAHDYFPDRDLDDRPTITVYLTISNEGAKLANLKIIRFSFDNIISAKPTFFITRSYEFDPKQQKNILEWPLESPYHNIFIKGRNQVTKIIAFQFDPDADFRKVSEKTQCAINYEYNNKEYKVIVQHFNIAKFHEGVSSKSETELFI